MKKVILLLFLLISLPINANELPKEELSILTQEILTEETDLLQTAEDIKELSPDEYFQQLLSEYEEKNKQNQNIDYPLTDNEKFSTISFQIPPQEETPPLLFELYIDSSKSTILNETIIAPFKVDGEYNIQPLNMLDTKNKMPLFNKSLPTELQQILSHNLKIYAGQTNLSDFDNFSLNFIAEKEFKSNEGVKIFATDDKFKYSLGVFNATHNNTSSLGGAIASQPLFLGKTKGSISFGTAGYINDLNTNLSFTTGIFSEYKNKNFLLNTQLARTYNYYNDEQVNKLYITPEFQLSKSFSLKLIHNENFTDLSNQNGIGLKYKPFQNKNDLEFEINSTTKNYEALEPTQNFKFSTKFRF